MDTLACNAFCAAPPHATHAVQWGGADVWKVCGKVFAIQWTDPMRVTFKVSPMAFEILSEAPGCIPAPSMASRGIKWIQWLGPQTLDADALRDHLTESHRLVAAGLTKKLRAKLGL